MSCACWEATPPAKGLTRTRGVRARIVYFDNVCAATSGTFAEDFGVKTLSCEMSMRMSIAQARTNVGRGLGIHLVHGIWAENFRVRRPCAFRLRRLALSLRPDCAPRHVC